MYAKQIVTIRVQDDAVQRPAFRGALQLDPIYGGFGQARLSAGEEREKLGISAPSRLRPTSPTRGTGEMIS